MALCIYKKKHLQRVAFWHYMSLRETEQTTVSTKPISQCVTMIIQNALFP